MKKLIITADIKQHLPQLLNEEITFSRFAEVLNERANSVLDEETLTIPDIRNKLSPITHLISMVETGNIEEATKALKMAKNSVNYLAQNEKYNL